MNNSENNRTRVIVCADHTIGYRLVEYILQNTATINVDMLRVYTNRENESNWWPSLKNLQKNFSFDLKLYDPETFESECKELKPDYLLLLSWKYVLPEKSIALANRGCINLHYSLLPQNRGVYPLNFALIKGETQTGVTFHFVSPAIDGGDIIIQEKLNIFSWDTTASLLPRADEMAFNLFKHLLKQLSETSLLNHLPQDDNLRYNSGKEYHRLDEIELNKTYKASEFINLLRGKSFEPHKKSLYFKDPLTGKKIFVSINLSPDENG